MKSKLIRGLVGLAFMVSMNSANALVADFIGLTENALGESAFSNFNFLSGSESVDISASKNGADAFAYFDWGNAGLGVCGAVDLADRNVIRSGQSSNVCNPGSDDNVTVAESLDFAFNSVVSLTLWFNNNHDGGFDMSDMVNINGTAYSVSTGYTGGVNGITVQGQNFNVAYNNEEFYVSGLSSTVAVPEPSTLGTLALGAVLLTLRRRQTR